MKLQDRIKLLANRINQPHYIEYHFKKAMQEAYLKGVKDTEEKQLSLCSVSGSVIVVESPSGQGYTGEIKGVYHQLTNKLKEDAKSKWWVCTEYEVKHYR